MNGSSRTESRFVLILIAGILAISCSAILVRFTRSTPPLVIAFCRQLFSAVLLLPFVQSADEPPVSRRTYGLLILSGFFLALHFATWLTGLTYTTVARATLFADLQPLWAAILGWFFLRERLTKLHGVGIAIVVAGGVLTSFHGIINSQSTELKGDLLAIAGGIAGAAYFIIGRKVRAEISWLKYMFSVYYLSAAWLFLLSFYFYRRLPLAATNDIFFIFLMALIPSIAGHGLFNLAVRHIKAYLVNAAFFGEPVIATILAFWLFQETPDKYFVIGALIVFAGLFLLFRPSSTT